jgi:hypothetical protein
MGLWGWARFGRRAEGERRGIVSLRYADYMVPRSPCVGENRRLADFREQTSRISDRAQGTIIAPAGGRGRLARCRGRRSPFHLRLGAHEGEFAQPITITSVIAMMSANISIALSYPT